jgi:hypothetical protein
LRRLILILICVACISGVQASPAAAFNPLKVVCGIASLTSGLLGKACNVVTAGGHIVGAGRQLLSGHLGSAVRTLLGQAGGAVGSRTRVALSLAAIGAWVLGGAQFALHEAAKVMSETTTPHLGTTWFSATYWRVAGIGALLTLPFLFAASIQALVHSDLTLLLRAVLGYLPLAALVVSVAAPVTMLLLSGSDEMSALVSSAAGRPGRAALSLLGLAGGLSAWSGSAFLVFLFGLLTVAGAMTLWGELVMREAAVYVVVLMLPLAFAALVWPARRMWAVRAVELLIALILSKFAMVAVLSLGGAAMGQIGHSPTAFVVGLVLVMMGAFAPWALLRLVPLAEMGASAVESLHGHAGMLASRTDNAFARGQAGDEWATATTTEMGRAAEQASSADAPAEPRRPEPAADAGPGGIDGHPSGASQPSGGIDGHPSSASQPSGAPTPAEEATGAGPAPSAPERLPGLSDMWQAEDLSWLPLDLGGEGTWPPQVWPPADSLPIAGSPLPDPSPGAGSAPDAPPDPA